MSECNNCKVLENENKSKDIKLVSAVMDNKMLSKENHDLRKTVAAYKSIMINKETIEKVNKIEKKLSENNITLD